MTTYSTPQEAFAAKESEFDDLVLRLKAMSDKRFGIDPDKADWGNVGDLGRYIELLKQVTDIYYHEGEFAE